MIDRLHVTVVGLTCCLATLGIAQASLGDAANWTTSDLDTWFYTNGVSPGARALAPSFFGGVTVNPNTQQFDPATSTDPARLGMALFAFNTSSTIASGLPASRYQVNSVTMTATWTYDSDPNT